MMNVDIKTLAYMYGVTGTIVPVLDAPYEVIKDVEIKGWV